MMKATFFPQSRAFLQASQMKSPSYEAAETSILETQSETNRKNKNAN